MIICLTVEWIRGETTRGCCLFADLDANDLEQVRQKYKEWSEGDSVWYTIEETEPLPGIPVVVGLRELEHEIAHCRD